MEIFCIPVDKISSGWIITDAKLGTGVYGSVYSACKKTDCSYVIKIIPLGKGFSVNTFKREVRAQRLLAKKGLAVGVADSWICPKKSSGVIIMKVLDMTVESFLLLDSSIDDQLALINISFKLLDALHKAGYYHGDAHLGNIMLEKVQSKGVHTFKSSFGYFRVYFVDMGKTGSLKNPGKILRKQLTAKYRIDADINYLKSEFKAYAKDAFKKYGK